METIACPLCGRSDARVVVRTDFNLTGAAGGPYSVVECGGCRLRYLSPRPGPDELARFYAEDYPAHTLRWKPDAGSSEQASLNRRLARIAGQRIALVRRYLPASGAPLRVLDVGCGNGAFLLELLRRGPEEGCGEAWGLDVAESALRQLGALDGRLRLVAGDLHGADLPAGHFDLITAWHVLEHDGDPVGVLRRAGELLRPGGVVLAEVPYSSGPIARLCGACWVGWDLPRHLVHFSPATLRRAAVRAGLGRVQVLRQFTLNPLVLSPLLASLVIWGRRRRGKPRMRRAAYHRWDGAAGAAVYLVNGLERFLGGNGLLLCARAG